MRMSWSPCHLLVWANSRSNAFPVGGTTLPSGRVISRGVDGVQRLPVARVKETVAVSHELEQVLGPTRRFRVGSHSVAFLLDRSLLMPQPLLVPAAGDGARRGHACAAESF
jgi:hypothetical protein